MENFNIKQFIQKKIDDYKLPYFKCVVMQNNRKVFDYRFSSLGSNDLLNMYSMAKPITVVALLQLVEKGLVSTNDFVSKYLDGYGDLFIKSTTKKVINSMQIHHLLTMTSGLDYDFNRPSIKELVRINPKANTVDIASLFAKDGILFEPGATFNYSTSIDVIAAIIEVVTGQKFSRYVEDNIFKPLGMNHSSFHNKLNVEKETIDEYAFLDGKMTKVDDYYSNFFPTECYESGGAGLIGSVDDYSLFVNSLACDEKLLKDSSIKKMSKIYVQSTPFDKSTNEFSKDNKDYGYGYGVRVRKHASSFGIPEGEFGWDGAAGSYCLCDRKNNISIVIGLNIHTWPSYLKDFHIKLVELIYNELFKK